MWTFPGASGTAGPLVRTGTCSDATTDTIALNNNTINSTQTSDFANCGNVRILDLSDNPIVLTNPNPLPFGFLTSLEVLKLRNVGPEGGKISDLTAITYPTYPSTNFVKLKTLDLSNNAITALPATFPTALSNLQVLKLTNAGAAATKISTLSNVVFPPALKLLDLEGNAITSISSTSFPSSLMFVSLAFLTFCISLSFVLVRGLTARPDALFAAQQTPVTQGESNLLNQWRYDYTEVLRC